MTTHGSVSVSESTDARSISSSRTLVDQEDARSDCSYERVEATPVEREANPTRSAAPEPQHDVDMTTADDGQPAADGGVASQADQKPRIGAEPMSCDPAPDDAADSATIDQRVLDALEHQKRSSGTDQQDVEEVMGSIINRLQAAIRPSSIDEETGIQLEKIMETFFVTTVNYTKKFDENVYQHEISFDRSITAFPAPDGPCSLYDALGRNFDQQILEESKLSRYTAIKFLPPVLHVLIQRSQSMGSKNGNAVVIPEILHLDRFMDAPHDSPVFRRRVEDWALTNRIADVKSQRAEAESDPLYMKFLDSCSNIVDGSGSGGPGGEQEPAGRAEATGGETWDFDGPVDDDFLVVTPAQSNGVAAPLPQEGQLRWMNARGTHAALRDMDKELAECERALDQHLDSMKSIAYRLHAVICHRGQLMSGHYWVWICDFEDRVWRRYNDADVCENKDTAEVLQTLSTSGEPYFLCYVRDEDKHEFVDVPKRQRAAAGSPGEAASTAGATATDTDGDVRVVDTGGRALDEGEGESQWNYRIE